MAQWVGCTGQQGPYVLRNSIDHTLARQGHGRTSWQQLIRGRCSAARLSFQLRATHQGAQFGQVGCKGSMEPPHIAITTASGCHQPRELTSATWPSGGLPRQWGALAPDLGAQKPSHPAPTQGDNELRVLTFNVLADGLDVNGGFLQVRLSDSSTDTAVTALS